MRDCVLIYLNGVRVTVYGPDAFLPLSDFVRARHRLTAIKAAISAGVVLGATITVAAFGGAETFARQGGDATTGLSELDKDYLKATAQSNLEEVKFEPVVKTHAASAQDKAYGERMKSDHARAEAALQAVAHKVGFALPGNVSEEQKHIMERLAQFHGARFDTAYRQEMIHDHTEDIAQTEREISLGNDSRVVAIAQKNLELLRMHLKMAQALTGSEGKNKVPGL